MPKLFDEIFAENRRTPGSGCGITNLLERLKPEDQTDLVQA